MKKIICTLLILMLIATDAYAGIWDRFKDVAISSVTGYVITGVFFLLSTVLGATVLKWKRLMTSLSKVLLEVYASTRPDSPGGAQITGKEVDAIVAKLGTFGIAGVEAWAAVKSK